MPLQEAFWRDGITIGYREPDKSQYMINKTQVPGIIDNALPVMQSRLNTLTVSLFPSVKAFADYTKIQIEHHNIMVVRKCFALADRMLHEGDTILSMAVCNIYLYSVSRALEQNDPFAKMCRSMLSEDLKREYVRQLYAKGS